MALLFKAAHAEQRQPEQSSGGLRKIDLADIPAEHPVHRFATIFNYLGHDALLPHERDVVQHEDTAPLFPWMKQIEPIELEGVVDFKILRQGSKHAERERRTYKDQWMRETVDPEFAEARYNEVIAASILRKALYSKGSTPTRERSFLYLLRGVFPVFAENQARLRLFLIEAEPYIVI